MEFDGLVLIFLCTPAILVLGIIGYLLWERRKVPHIHKTNRYLEADYHAGDIAYRINVRMVEWVNSQAYTDHFNRIGPPLDQHLFRTVVVFEEEGIVAYILQKGKHYTVTIIPKPGTKRFAAEVKKILREKYMIHNITMNSASGFWDKQLNRK